MTNPTVRQSKGEGGARLRRFAKRLTLWIVAVLVVLLGIGVEVAYAFIAGGGGTGTGTASVPAAQVITPSASTISGTLYPGGTADLNITISNPYTNVGLAVTGVVSAGAVTGCATPGVNVVTPTGITPSTLAPGASHVQVIFSGAITMTTSSSNDCQGATLTVPVAVTTKVG